MVILQEQAFAKVKSELTKPTVVALYDPAVKTKICADMLSYGIGAVLSYNSIHNSGDQ